MNEKRKVYYEKFDAQLDAWSAQIEVLKAKSTTIRAEIAQEYNAALDTFQVKHAEALSRLRELKASGDEAWNELVAALEKVLEEGKAAYENAASRIRT
jgi:predicted kinase